MQRNYLGLLIWVLEKSLRNAELGIWIILIRCLGRWRGVPPPSIGGGGKGATAIQRLGYSRLWFVENLLRSSPTSGISLKFSAVHYKNLLITGMRFKQYTIIVPIKIMIGIPNKQAKNEEMWGVNIFTILWRKRLLNCPSNK